MASSPKQHKEGTSGLEVAQEVATERGGVLVQVVILFGADTKVILVPMAQRLEIVHVDFLKQVTRKKAEQLGEGLWRQATEKTSSRKQGHSCY